MIPQNLKTAHFEIDTEIRPDGLFVRCLHDGKETKWKFGGESFNVIGHHLAMGDLVGPVITSILNPEIAANRNEIISKICLTHQP
jgi:hypothetical protein